MDISTPRPLRSSLRQPQSQPSPLNPYTPVPDTRARSRAPSRNVSRTPRTPAVPLTATPVQPSTSQAGSTQDARSPKRRSWLSREPATPRQRISNYYPARSPSQQPYPPFFPPQGYSPASSPWHTPNGRPLYVVDPNYPTPGPIAPVDSGIGVLSPPTVSGPYSRPPRDSAISEEGSIQPPAHSQPLIFAPEPSPARSPNYLVGHTEIPDNLQPISHGEAEMSLDPGAAVLGPAGGTTSPTPGELFSQPTEAPKSNFVGGFVSGLKNAFGRRRRSQEEQYVAEPYPMDYAPNYQQNGVDQSSAPPSTTVHGTTTDTHGSYVYEPQFAENEPKVVGHTQQAPGTISNDPLPLPLETPFGSPTTIVTPFLLTRPVSGASPPQDTGDVAATPAPAAVNVTGTPAFAPAVSYYAPPGTSYVPPMPPPDGQGYTSPPQASDYLKMSTGPASVPLSSYFTRFKAFLKTINDLPWVASERVTIDYYPGQQKKGVFGRQERRWTVSWTRKGNSETESGQMNEVKPSGRLNEIDLSSSGGSAPSSPVPFGPNGIQYPQYYQPFMLPGYYYPDPSHPVPIPVPPPGPPQLYYSYGDPIAGDPIYPYAANENGQRRPFALLMPQQPQVPQPTVYPAGYAPDHRPDQAMWGSPVHQATGSAAGTAQSDSSTSTPSPMQAPQVAVA